ncbi:MAG: sigma-70 family RNA polymerase sigma factor [Acidobacteriota bacterium]
MPLRLSEKTVVALLRDWSGGDKEALERLLPLVYNDLRRHAAGLFRHERPDHTLQPTAVVHEAWLRMSPAGPWTSRSQFFAVAGRLMREVLIDHARRRATAKRGGGETRLTYDDALETPASREPDASQAVELLALDAALEKLESLDARQARVVELRYFAGLSIEETAEALNISPATVKREWQMARAWLRDELGAGGKPS